MDGPRLRPPRRGDRPSITMTADFCVAVLEDAPARHGEPGIVDADQGGRFTGTAFADVPHRAGVATSMDGGSAWRDDVLVERRSVTDEEVCPRAADGVSGPRASIAVRRPPATGRARPRRMAGRHPTSMPRPAEAHPGRAITSPEIHPAKDLKPFGQAEQPLSCRTGFLCRAGRPAVPTTFGNSLSWNGSCRSSRKIVLRRRSEPRRRCRRDRPVWAAATRPMRPADGACTRLTKGYHRLTRVTCSCRPGCTL